MSKTLLRHTLTNNIFDIFVDFLIFIHFHFMKIHSLFRLCRDGIYVDKILVSEYKLVKNIKNAIFFFSEWVNLEQKYRDYRERKKKQDPNYLEKERNLSC